jgi:CDP-paratose 2-epimerase
MRMLITGGAGFIGSNATAYFTRAGHRVTLLDNLSRAGSEANVTWLRSTLGANDVELVRGDVRDFDLMVKVCRQQDAIIHLAGQVAVTTSVADPRHDFESNALGTFNVLEGARAAGSDPVFIYASTNKVYGGMEGARVIEEESRYSLVDLPNGVPEEWPLDFHSPYGCSKGAGDQYVRDYHRIYGLPTIVFRQSAIYGPRQFGIEDQGWLAHFVIRCLLEQPFTIYGDGKQTRDLLYIDDLLRAFGLAIASAGRVAGQVYNIGGGPDRSLSVWAEAAPLLERLADRTLEPQFGDWRPGDQRVYISDISKARRELSWEPTLTPEQGLGVLWEWVRQNVGELAEVEQRVRASLTRALDRIGAESAQVGRP